MIRSYFGWTGRPLILSITGIQKEIEKYARTDEDVLMFCIISSTSEEDYLGRREDPFYDVKIQYVDVTIDV